MTCPFSSEDISSAAPCPLQIPGLYAVYKEQGINETLEQTTMCASSGK